MPIPAGGTPLSSADSKRNMRAELRAWRQRLPRSSRQAAARAVAQQFSRHRQLRHASRVAVFLSYGAELDTTPLIRVLHRHGTDVYVPALRPGDPRMRFTRLRPYTPLRRNHRGLRQPQTPRPLCTVEQLDLILVPLLAFDANGGRLGQGGGYYDRCFVRRSAGHPRLIGLAYAGQHVEQVPVEAWDIRLDGILTERGLLRCRTTPRSMNPENST